MLVSKDINLRIKAAVLGVHAEDYYSDKTLEDSDVLYSGMTRPARRISGSSTARTCARGRKASARSTRSPARPSRDWQSNAVRLRGQPEGHRGASSAASTATTATIELLRDYRNERHSVWGITARNREQNFALNLLMDPEIDFVTVLGPAGTGKTLLALAAGLMQTLETQPLRRDHHDARDDPARARTSASCPARKRKRWSPGWAR